jgi:hypothetical protein
LQELEGKIDWSGKHDIQSGALPVTKYVVELTREWLWQTAGVEPDAAGRLRRAGVEENADAVCGLHENRKDPLLLGLVQQAGFAIKRR